MRTLNATLVAMRLFCFATMSALAAGPTTAPTTAPAVSVAGKWNYTLQIEEMQISATADLKEDGNNVTGSVTTFIPDFASTLSVTDGNVTENNVRFTVDRVSDTGTFRTTYRGKIDRDKILGTVEFGWVDIPNHPGTSKADWIATRVKQ